MILAAGKGTRLGELGASLPKPMLRLGDRPVLEWTIERLRDSGVGEVVINLHHAASVIPDHFGDGSAWGMRISYLFETEILGTAGGVRNASHLLGGDRFLAIYGDTVLDWDPLPMIDEHVAAGALASIVVAQVEDPSRLGVVVFDHTRRIERFVEKPGHQPQLGRGVNAGLFVLEPAIFDYIPRTGFSDFGASVLPDLLSAGQLVRAYPRPRPLIVLDTPEQLAEAQRLWRALA
jgi:NDP-sugar pyrophosphorylase family protein